MNIYLLGKRMASDDVVNSCYCFKRRGTRRKEEITGEGKQRVKERCLCTERTTRENTRQHYF